MSNEAIIKHLHTPSGRRYHFDLIRDGEVVRDPGGILLRDDDHAVTVAQQLAHDLVMRRANLNGRNCSIKVRDDRGHELRHVIVNLS